MNKFLFILTVVLTLALPVSVRAQYYSINVDYKTMAAMSEAYATEATMEALHNENLQKIYDSYKAAEVASAGIFSSKYLDRKALTNLNLWNDKDENYYYKRIYNIVSKRIIPKMITCAELMVKDPSTAIYWGSYLVKTTEDVKSLCQQFESVVTNSTLSFNDIAFLEITDQFKQIFNITKLGGIDWKSLFDNLGNDINGSFTKDNLEHDLDLLIQKGAGLASAGYTTGVGQLMQGTDFSGTFMDKMGSVITLASNASTAYDAYKDMSTSDILTTLMGQDNINGLFNLSDYNISKWVDDYSESAQGRYYTQRVYIYRRDYGSEQLCNYQPPTDDDNIIYGSQWYRFSTTDPDFWPSSTQKEAVLVNSESHAGWSRDKVKQLNSSDDKYDYDMSYYISAYIISRGGNQYSKAYAYSINVTKSWDIKEEVYEAVFDSYSMDWNTFMAQMNARLQQYNANGDHQEITNEEELQNYINTHPQESNYTYYIGYDSKNYYTATDARKLAGSSSATFSVTCHDGGTLGEGSTTYKCGDCGGNPSSHTKDCSMYTSLKDEPIQTGELSSELTRLQSQVANLQAKIDVLTAENSELLHNMANAETSAEYNSYRTQYNSNKSKISSLQRQLDDTNKSIKDTQQAIEEAQEGEKAQTDEFTRIPQLMKTMKDAYGITWTDNGSWSGYTFIRQGTVGSVKGAVTFKATVSIARRPKYFLGIKIHRAIVQINWELTSSWSDTSVVEVLELDPSKSDEENSKIVNQKMSELAQSYPNCEISVELNKNPSTETENVDGVNHLLWSSDRLEIARGIEARLAKIYTDLVMVEKFLHYRHTVRDLVSDILPKLSADEGRKMTIAERCRRRWLHNGGSTYYDEEEEDDQYDEE